MASNSALKSREIYKCDVCAKNLNSFKSYLKHVRIHTPKELLQIWSRCEICEQFYPTDFDRQSHGLKDHSDILKTIKCPFCPNESLSNKDFFNHAQDKHLDEILKNWIKCEKCEAYRPSRISLNVHVKSSHKIDDVLVLERKLLQIKCKYCPLIFGDKIEYQEHLDSHESGQKSSLTITKLSQKTRDFECEFCITEMVFQQKRAYLEHVKNEHYNDICLTWTKCGNCGIFHPKHWDDHGCFVSQTKIEAIEAKPKNICVVCQTKFDSDEKCFQHMEQMHPLYVQEHFSYQCDACPSKRPDKTTLMLHKLSHLSSGFSGPTIKIISKSVPKPITGQVRH